MSLEVAARALSLNRSAILDPQIAWIAWIAYIRNLQIVYAIWRFSDCVPQCAGCVNSQIDINNLLLCLLRIATPTSASSKGWIPALLCGYLLFCASQGFIPVACNFCLLKDACGYALCTIAIVVLYFIKYTCGCELPMDTCRYTCSTTVFNKIHLWL